MELELFPSNTYIHLLVPYLTLHIDTYILLMTPKYTSLSHLNLVYASESVSDGAPM